MHTLPNPPAQFACTQTSVHKQGRGGARPGAGRPPGAYSRMNEDERLEYVRQARKRSEEKYRKALAEHRMKRCWICSRRFVLPAPPSADEEKAGGFICSHCARILLLVKNDPVLLERAAEYLDIFRRPPASRVHRKGAKLPYWTWRRQEGRHCSCCLAPCEQNDHLHFALRQKDRQREAVILCPSCVSTVGRAPTHDIFVDCVEEDLKALREAARLPDEARGSDAGLDTLPPLR